MSDRELLREARDALIAYGIGERTKPIIARITARLSEPDDVVTVPREPTQAMLDAAQEVDTEGEDSPLDAYRTIYVTMCEAYAAAQKG